MTIEILAAGYRLVKTSHEPHIGRVGTLGELIRDRRLGLGQTQVDLAAASGIAQGTISRIERGAYKEVPPPELLNPIAAALGMTATELLAGMGYAMGADASDAGGLAAIEPIRAEMIRKLRRVRLNPARVKSIDGLLDLCLGFDSEEGAKEVAPALHDRGVE